jgi:F1F0 ATPase subunit 2
MTSNLLWLSFAFGAGILLGIFYFGCLWVTVRRIPSSRWPCLLSYSSFMTRMTVTFIGFYTIMGCHWERLLFALLAFLAVRSVAIRRWGPGLSPVRLLR